MFKNYLKIAIRNFLKNKIFSLINISGLALGLTVVIITMLFVKDELKYDQFHENKSNLYRIINGNANDTDSYAGTPAPMGPYLKNNFSQILNFTRLEQADLLLQYGKEIFSEKQVFLVDSTFLNIFTFPLIQGDSKTALRAPNSIVVTEAMAKKYFGQENPIGKILTTENGAAFEVTAVAANVPLNSHLHFDFLMRFDQLALIYGGSNSAYLEQWGSWNYFTYVLLAEHTAPKQLKATVLKTIETSMPDRLEMFQDLNYQPITDIHFQYNRKNIEPAFDKKYLYIFISAAALVLILACINFMNLSISLSMKRSKEVGLRKVVGANRKLIIQQFLGEAVLFTFLAFLVSIIFVEILLPNINRLSGKTLSLQYSDYHFILAFLGIVLLTGLLSGTYPAFVLSSFLPAKIFKNEQNPQNASLRNFLVVFQFVVTVALITSILVINQQLRFIENKNLGFNRDYVVNIPLESRSLMEKSQTIKNGLIMYPNILNVSANRYKASYFNEHWGGIRRSGRNEDEASHGWWIIRADQDFLKTFDIKLTEDVLFSGDFKTSGKRSFIVNETARKEMGLEPAAGEEIIYGGNQTGRIVGVVKDFHFRSLHHKIAPCAIVLSDYGSQLSLKIKSTDVQTTLNFIENKWKEITSNMPFTYYFFDEDIGRLYKSETTIRHVLSYLTVLSIFIACLGLLGLATFIAQRRTKEIGIRKVFGASMPNIVSILTERFTRWVLIANLIAWPIAWYAMTQWLQNFAYRINLTLWPFVLSGFLTLVVALLTVCWQAIRAATANPVEALRYE